jgi:hypothetical protein
MGTTSGGQDFAVPVAAATGFTSTVIPGLAPGTPYYFVARARDLAGNIETNTVEKSATTLGIDLEPKNAAIGIPSLYTISADIYNNGSTAASNVLVYIESCDTLYCECHDITIPSIPASNFVAVSIDPSYVPPIEYRIIVDPNNAIPGEIQEGNNCIDSGGAILLCGGTWPTSCGM